MIAWKCNVGHTTNESPNLISSITWTDLDRRFSFATVSSASPDVYENGDGDLIYQLMSSLLGNVVDAFYVAPSCRVNSTIKKYYEKVFYYLPSIRFGYPNIYNFFDSNEDGSVLYAYHFTTLNRIMLIKWWSSSAVRYKIGKVTSAGGITWTTNWLYSQVNFTSLGNNISNSEIAQVGIPCINDYQEGLDLSNLNVWRTCYFGYGSYRRDYMFSFSTPTLEYNLGWDEIVEALFKDNNIPPDNILTGDDPFGPGGDSGTGGGGGDFDNTSTPVEIPNLPTISASSTGFISLFNPSLSELNNLASYLWSDLFDIDGWKKIFADPMDAVLGLSILPVSIPSGGIKEVKVGNIGTGISLTIAATQFVEVDCGSIDVNEYWGAYLDYEPYTQAQIFLPYIGTRPISVDEIMGKTVRVVYHVDILTGACCCFVKCGDSVLYTYNGQCSIPIPITGANYTSIINGVINIAASVGSLVATRGTSAPTAVPGIASSAINQMKPSIEKSGAISGSAGILNMQTPYLILIRPRQALPSKQNEFIGYPSLVTVQLAELTGYTEVQSIHLENIPATQEELAEIQSLLKGGVIF